LNQSTRGKNTTMLILSRGRGTMVEWLHLIVTHTSNPAITVFYGALLHISDVVLFEKRLKGKSKLLNLANSRVFCFILL